MLLKCDNRILIYNQPSTFSVSSAPSGTSNLTVASSSGFSANDFILIGKLGDEGTIINRINSITANTFSLASSLNVSLPNNVSVTKIDYNQVKFFYASSPTGSKTLLSTKDIDPTEIYTFYDDTSHNTGYFFVRFYNSNASTYSAYSNPIPYTGYTAKSLRRIRNKIRRLLDETDEINSPIKNEEINDEINNIQKEIAQERLWSFYEKTKSFSTVANQYEYDIGDDVFSIYEAKYKDYPLQVIGFHQFNVLKYNNNTTGTPTHICVWNKKLIFYPTPASDANTTTISSDISDTDETIQVANTSSFPSSGRIIIDDEVISYTSKTPTSFTGCVRGEEDTTPASHLASASVLERDIICHYQKNPSDLIDETDETDISNPSLIAYGAASELAPRCNKPELADRYLLRYEKLLNKLIKNDEPKIRVSFGRVREIENDNINNLNLYPKNINL